MPGPEQQSPGGLQPLTCARCGHGIGPLESTEASPSGGRQHALERCYAIVSGRLKVAETELKIARLESEQAVKAARELQDQIPITATPDAPAPAATSEPAGS